MAGMDTPHFPGSMFPKIGNAFPTAWELPPGKIVADIVFARPRPPPAEVSALALADEAPSWCKAGKRIPTSLETMDPGDAGDQLSLVPCGSYARCEQRDNHRLGKTNCQERRRESMYYRVAIQGDPSLTWQWKSTPLSSLNTLLHWLQYFRAFPQARLRIFSSPSREELNDQLARENQGLLSTSVMAAPFLQERLI